MPPALVCCYLFCPSWWGTLTGNFNAIAITQVTAIYAGFQLLGAPILGRCSDRYGRKPVLAVTVAISTIALVGSGLASNLATLMVWQAINGAFAGVFAVAQAIVADSVEAGDQRTVSFGALGASLGLGFVAGPALGRITGIDRSTSTLLCGSTVQSHESGAAHQPT